MSRVTALHLAVHNRLYHAAGSASACQKACKVLQKLCKDFSGNPGKVICKQTDSGLHLIRAKDELLCNTAAHADINRRAYLLPRLREFVPVRAQHLEERATG